MRFLVSWLLCSILATSIATQSAPSRAQNTAPKPGDTFDLNDFWQTALWGDAEFKQSGLDVTLTTHSGRVFQGKLDGNRLDLVHALTFDETRQVLPSDIRKQMVGKFVHLSGTISADGNSFDASYFDKKPIWVVEQGEYRITEVNEDEVALKYLRHSCIGNLPYWLKKSEAKLGSTIIPVLPDEEQIARNRIITKAYAALYIDHPDIFKWAGMAAFASNLVGFGMFVVADGADSAITSANDLALQLHSGALRLAIHTLLEPGGGSFGNPFAGGDRVTLLRVRVYGELGIGNIAIFRDMYWQHLAYLKCGLKTFEEMHADEKLPAVILNAWQKIDNGKKLGDQDLVWQGNKELLRYEQEVILQPLVYGPNPDLWRAVSNPVVGLWAPVESPIPQDGMSLQKFHYTQQAKSILTKGSALVDLAINGVPPSPDVGDFAQRWRWIEESMLPAWRNLSDSEPQMALGYLIELPQ